MFCSIFLYTFLLVGIFVNVKGYDDNKKYLLKSLIHRRLTRGVPCDNPNDCRSIWGYCGQTPDYCGGDCQAGPCKDNSGNNNGGNNGNGNSGGQTFQGDGTYYDVSVGYTACGTTHNNGEFIAALNAPQFDPFTPDGNPNHNTLCNKQVRVFGPKGSATVTIVDKCPGCKYGDLDLSEAAFGAVIGDLGIGRARITWNWV